MGVKCMYNGREVEILGYTKLPHTDGGFVTVRTEFHVDDVEGAYGRDEVKTVLVPVYRESGTWLTGVGTVVDLEGDMTLWEMPDLRDIEELAVSWMNGEDWFVETE